MAIFNTVYGWKWLDAWWNIDSNTICYLKLRWNLTDETGNYTWSMAASWSFDTSVANISVAHLTYNNWYVYTSVNWPQIKWANSYTISWWVKADGNFWLFNSWFSQDNYNWISVYKNGSNNWFVMYCWWYSWSNGFEFNNTTSLGTGWNLITCTYTPWSRKIYINGSLANSWVSTITNNSNPTKPMEIWRQRWDSSNSPVWYYSDILFDGKERTATEISDYYNATKWFYWL